MKKVFLVAFASFISIVTVAQHEIKAEEAKNNIGDTVKVCITVADTNYDELAKGSPTFLYTSAQNSFAGLYFIIWGERRKYFDYKPEKDLNHRNVCISGKIELVKDRPVIIIEKQSQVDLQ